jgi:glycine betaine/proline transport system ATP-binding protein
MRMIKIRAREGAPTERGGSPRPRRSGIVVVTFSIEDRDIDSSRQQPSTKISVRRLSKIFGPHPGSVLDALDAGHSKGGIMEQSGHVVAVRDASFDVAEGEIFVIMGLSGSGKSTLVRMINRLIEPTRGEVLIDDQDLTRMDKQQLIELRRHGISMVFQSFALMPHLTNLENAAFGLAVADVKEPERSQRARRALETVGLAEFADGQPHELSGGMQQRVGLARALAVEPAIMLMDEAFSALDPLIRTEMQRELLTIQRERGITVVFVSHDLDEALSVGDRIAIMDDGAVVQVGTPRELVMAPANEYVQHFFERIDVSRILTAGDVAQTPRVSVRLAGDGARAVAPRLDAEPARFVYVCDAAGIYRGVAGRDEWDAACRNEEPVDETLLDDVRPIGSNQTLAQIIDRVAVTRCPAPVVGPDGGLRGVISRTAFLKALRKGRAT